MRRRPLLCMALLLVIGLIACTTTPFRPRPLPVATPIDASKACADWRWIGIKNDPGKACPDVPGWSESPLFQRPYSSHSTYEVVQELNRFCVYEIEENLLSPPSPPRDPELMRVDRDCAVVSPSAGTELERKTWEPLSSHFLAQVRGMERALKADPSVRLAFLDTQPDSQAFPAFSGNSRHGYTLAHIARNLLCQPGEDCIAKIGTRLALPLLHFDSKHRNSTKEDHERGGFFGTLSQLARAIEVEVSDWQTHKVERHESHLVLNLSVAWDGNLFGELSEGEVSEMQAGAQAVYWALHYAAAHDVLVLAAAGNQRYGPAPGAGPLLPAAWEIGGSVEESRAGRNAPLVYAVGGVQSSGYPLANARSGGLPRRVAYADHAVVAFSNGEPTATYTGSSVATAVVSSIAAFVWSYFPDLEPSQVMAILDASGKNLKYPADFWAGSDLQPASKAPQVHQLSLRAALVEACRQYPGHTSCPEWTEPPLTSSSKPVLSSILEPGPTQPPQKDVFRWLPKTSPCKAEKVLYQGAIPVSPFLCPSDQYWGISSQRWLLPQPEDPPCPNCVIVRPPDNSVQKASTLYGEIPADWPGGCLVGATLDIRAVDSRNRPVLGSRVTFRFQRPVCKGDEFEQTIPAEVKIDNRTMVVLSFVMQTKVSGSTSVQMISVQSPVLVAQ